MTYATIIDGLIPLAGGVYATLVGTNKITFESNLKMKNWANDNRKLFLIAGPLLIIFGILKSAGVFQ
jgi:hypothetical protein